MELQDTVNLMQSTDYKDRFIAEYWQLKIRYDKLTKFLSDWDNDTLTIQPSCARGIHEAQLSAMKEYLHILEMRATIEKIEI